jgi:hypothetical protein
MKILHVIKSLVIGGAEKLIVDLVPRLLAKIVNFVFVAFPLRVKYTTKENKEYLLSYLKF